MMAIASLVLVAAVTASETAFLLEKDLIPENIAYDAKTRAFFVGSMYKAKIIRIGADGVVSDFVPSRRDGLLSVLGMKIDPARRGIDGLYLYYVARSQLLAFENGKIWPAERLKETVILKLPLAKSTLRRRGA